MREIYSAKRICNLKSLRNQRDSSSYLLAYSVKAEIIARGKRLMKEFIVNLSSDQKHCSYHRSKGDFKEIEHSLCENL